MTARGDAPPPGAGGRGTRDLLLLGAGIVLVVVIVVAVAVLVSRRGQPQNAAGTEAPEQDAARVTPDDASGSPIANIGSGGCTTSDWYVLCFTDPKYPDNPANHKGGLDVQLVQFMDKAQHTLDVADYDFDLADVADAMVRAKQRGVTVRMVTDSDTINDTKNKPVQDALGKLKKAGITFIGDDRKPIMHNKFTVVDQEWVETGSWNYTDGDTYHLNNNMIIIHSKDLAANYAAEFDKMFVKRQFGPTKDPAIPHPTLTIEGTKIQNCFASEGHCADKIVSTINGAQQSIEFMAFSFTSDKIGTAMLARHQAGVGLTGVFETTGSNTSFSEYTKMKKDKIPVYQDGNPWVMHHKVIVIDKHIVIFGSFNFSDNADKDNDENLLIVDDPRIAAAFQAEFDRVLALAKNPPPRKK
ncbi:MAG TPA: phospholipase D-like domain-containing protein [Thermomicrobiales bacterium]|nr:phospholipase D-like domain-containing protein [Thermomicrobiales bacterium]